MKKFDTYRLVKTEDLNHHGTLFAGRISEWFVESGFIAVANHLKPENIVCVKIHGMLFSKPVRRGDIVKLTSQTAYAGKTSVIVYIKMSVNKNSAAVVDGFITFVNVDKKGKPLKHGLKLSVKSKEDKALNLKAKKLKSR